MKTKPQIQKTIAKPRSSLSMDIYSAMLGNAPTIEKAPPEQMPRLRMRVKVEAKLEHAGVSPFRRPTLREHVERCAAYAARAIEEARTRLAAARGKINAPEAAIEAERPNVTPITLVGASVKIRSSKTADARAA